MHRCDCSRHALPNRRSFLTGLASIGAAPLLAFAEPAEPTATEDERFMRIAIAEAKLGDFPFGAVIVREGRILARGRNLGRRNADPTAHGEMVAIRRCIAMEGSRIMRGSTLYTSGEPCAMCMGAILWSHFGRLVYAASFEQLATKIDQIMVPSQEIAAKAPFAPIAIKGGVLADEAMSLFAKK
jgi:tRNA(Arg) A34 adenosine deaminase TadA